MEEDMPYTELRKWINFFEERPIGWRDDYRAFLIMKSMGYKGKAEDVFASIRQIKKVESDKKVNDRAIPKGVLLAKMMSAKGGDIGIKDMLKGKKNG
jgi:hypothetical protein